MTEPFDPIRTPVALPSIDRSSVRALVEEDSAHMRLAHRAGVNAHQVALDRTDQINAFAASLSEPDRAVFLKLYQEEMGASSRSMMDQAKKLNAQTAAKSIKQITRAAQVSRALTIIAITAIGILMMRVIMLG
jgi:hypothetical protein